MARYSIRGEGKQRVVRRLREAPPEPPPEFLARVRRLSEDRRSRVGVLLSLMLGLRLEGTDARDRMRLLAVPLLFIGVFVLPGSLALLWLAAGKTLLANTSVFAIVALAALGTYLAGTVALLFAGTKR